MADLKAFALHLAEPELELATLTRNRIHTVGKTALSWAYDDELSRDTPYGRCRHVPET